MSLKEYERIKYNIEEIKELAAGDGLTNFYNQNLIDKWVCIMFKVRKDELYYLLKYWKSNLPGVKILEDLKISINKDDILQNFIINNVYRHKIIEYDDECDMVLNLSQKEELFDLLVYFGLKIDLDKYDYFFDDLERMINFKKKIEKIHYGQKIAKYVKESMDDSLEMKPLRTKMDLRKFKDLLEEEK
jgi:hypothetical protein